MVFALGKLGRVVAESKAFVAEVITAAERLRRRVRRLLKFSRWTQEDLARALGVSQPAVSNRLRGEVEFQMEDLDRIAAFFGLTVPELFFDEYGRFDRRKHRERRSGTDRRKRDLFQLREEAQPWHPPARRETPPRPSDDEVN